MPEDLCRFFFHRIYTMDGSIILFTGDDARTSFIIKPQISFKTAFILNAKKVK